MTPGKPSEPDTSPENTAASAPQETPRVRFVPRRRHFGRPDGWWRGVRAKLIAARTIITLPLCRTRKNREKRKV